jgi:hypothetical protein
MLARMDKPSNPENSIRQVEGYRGPRYIGGAEVRLGREGELAATLFTVTEQLVTPEDLVERAKEGAAERSLTPAQAEIVARYSQEPWQRIEVGGREVVFPMTPLAGADRYLDQPDRVDDMQIQVLPGKFKAHEALAGYKSELMAAHPHITDGRMVSVAGYDAAANRLIIRECGYHDTFAFATSGADRRIGRRSVNGLVGETVRDLASNDKLPELSPDAIVPNSLGVGGILFTGDGQILLARRRTHLGVASAAGTFGYAAAGNLNFGDELLRAIDDMPAHEALASQGIGIESTEELGLNARFINLGQVARGYITEMIERELGLSPEEVSISPAGLVRDGVHVGLVQATYVLATPKSAEQVVESMVVSTDAKKEYDMVLAVPISQVGVAQILSNAAMANGVNINTETRSSLALIASQRRGLELLSAAQG